MNENEPKPHSPEQAITWKMMHPALKIGLGLIVFSFLMVGVALVEGAFAAAEEATGMHDAGMRMATLGAWMYAASWVPFILGFIVGGKPAYELFKAGRRRLLNRLFRKA